VTEIQDNVSLHHFSLLIVLLPSRPPLSIPLLSCIVDFGAHGQPWCQRCALYSEGAIRKLLMRLARQSTTSLLQEVSFSILLSSLVEIQIVAFILQTLSDG
jgi:hypothetical protein